MIGFCFKVIPCDARTCECNKCKSEIFLLLWQLSKLNKLILLPYRVNVTVGRAEERMMTSGMHTVEDIYCCCCGQLLGWKYVRPFCPIYGFTSEWSFASICLRVQKLEMYLKVYLSMTWSQKVMAISKLFLQESSFVSLNFFIDDTETGILKFDQSFF